MDDQAPVDWLEQYLAVTADAEADRCLEQILEELAAPLVRRVVASVVRNSSAFAEIEDIVADTLLDLLRRLRDLREGDTEPIHDLRRYIVTCAYNRCHERLRERHPARTRLRNQLRYLFSHDRELALWRGTQGELVCGFRDWAGRRPACGDHLDDLPPAPRSDPAAENRVQVAMLAPMLLHETNAPLTLDTMTAAIARMIGVEQHRAEVPLTDLEQAMDAGPDAALENRMSLEQLWDDVRKLALKQRVALLLNLRDVHGRECLTLLPLTHTATIAEIAIVVGMRPDAFAARWNELPLTDKAIGELLEMTPRQVIKLRRLARERLRRMAKHREPHQNLGHEIDSAQSGITIVTRR